MPLCLGQSRSVRLQGESRLHTPFSTPFSPTHGFNQRLTPYNFNHPERLCEHLSSFDPFHPALPPSLCDTTGSTNWCRKPSWRPLGTMLGTSNSSLVHHLTPPEMILAAAHIRSGIPASCHPSLLCCGRTGSSAATLRAAAEHRHWMSSSSRMRTSWGMSCAAARSRAGQATTRCAAKV